MKKKATKNQILFASLISVAIIAIGFISDYFWTTLYFGR